MSWSNYGRGSKQKYHAQKVEYGRERFDSKAEYWRFIELRQAEKDGKIKDLKRQVKYVLIPAQKDKKGKVIEREVAYKADFVYTLPNGEEVVEDVKGFNTKDFIIKRKLMLYVHGIRLHIVHA